MWQEPLFKPHYMLLTSPPDKVRSLLGFAGPECIIITSQYPVIVTSQMNSKLWRPAFEACELTITQIFSYVFETSI